MSAWYYTQEGTIYGPFSEEAIKVLIDSGKVSFVTPVWNSDTKDEVQKWLYAFDTPLASLFSEDFQTLDMPSTPQIGLPPIPLEQEPAPEETPTEEAIPDPPAPTEQTEAEPSPRKAADPKKESLKSPPLIVLFLALFIIGLIIGTTFWYLIN